MNLFAENPPLPMLDVGGATQAQTIFLWSFICLKQSELLNGIPVEGAYPFGRQSGDNGIEPDETKRIFEQDPDQFLGQRLKKMVFNANQDKLIL